MRSRLLTLPYLLLLLPFDLLVALSLFVSVLFSFRKHRVTQTQRPDTSKATIIIVNWNGKHLLEECLPSVIEAAQPSHEILVVDNGSTDGSVSSCATVFRKSEYCRWIGTTATAKAITEAWLKPTLTLSSC